MLNRPQLGLIVPPASGAVPPDAATIYPQYSFLAEGLGLTELSSNGYDSVIETVGAAAVRLAARGASVVSLMGTSLSFYRGPDFNAVLENEIAVRAGVPALTMSTAILEAATALGVRRLAVATAYRDDVNASLQRFLEAAGIEVLSLEHLGIASVDAVHQVPEDDVTDLGRRAFASAPDAEAVLISCGGLATRAAVRTIEAEAGIPVITSPLAGLWATVSRAGVDPRAEGAGRLFQTTLEQ
ncbi:MULTISPECIES: aspartate/glutamate racemase family protein [Aminobacter]|jgi:arylmalonate decarboxylase|uniref:Arylmalonate decarboxylase n=2 Tax=Aminobacter TaxID=31988 RepID=A0AAC9ATD9_AMIAI|nr:MULTISPECIES: aspartate/glutamate racemase family protein [Aminobacter]AMS44788.1 Maleate cis-trans isomerase [Aminobacter aminovorans]MBA8908127.1 arylmalonate decarboxylase [Aminobacter ciceronei]MBA9021889.1 arylmalonate decarboxylase [Aminobacter ciceronei]MBB3704418.1 arylmalonate decarboxylase [Aminobacter aminovorans]WMD00600.1 aspartate/glutamate racemase family protein [Aminobacter niigataensis]